MFVNVCCSYLGLARHVLVIVVMVIVSTLAVPENMDPHNLIEGGFSSSKLISNKEFLHKNANATCASAGGACKDRCDCCQKGIDSYDCKPKTTGSSSERVCTSTQPPPYRCGYRPPTNTKPCKPFDAVCKENCDCCQYDQGRKKPHRVECERDWSSSGPAIRKKCTPFPFAIVDCFVIPPPPTPPPTTTKAPQG